MRFGKRSRNLVSWQLMKHFREMIPDFCNEYPLLIFMPQSCKLANRIMQRCSAHLGSNLHISELRVSFIDLCPPSSFRSLSVCPRVGVRVVRGDRPGWRRIFLVYRRRANSCEVSRMMGQGARKRSVASCQGRKTHGALSEARASTQHRCWKRRGYKIEEGREEGEQSCRYIENRTITIQCLCWTESCLPLWSRRGINSQVKRSHSEAVEGRCHLSPVAVISLTGVDRCEPEPGTLFHLYYPSEEIRRHSRGHCAPVTCIEVRGYFSPPWASIITPSSPIFPFDFYDFQCQAMSEFQIGTYKGFPTT